MAKTTFETAALFLEPQRHGVRWAGGGMSGLSGDVEYEPIDGGGLSVTVDDARNLTPMFSSLPWDTSNGYWNTMQYTATTRKAHISDEDAGDGWATVVFDPSLPDSASIAAQVSPATVPWMTAGDEYQLMVEMSDFTGEPPSTATFTMMAGALRDVLRPANNAQLSIPFVEGVQRIPVKAFQATGQARMMRIEIRNNSIDAYWSGRLRLSLWEPGYDGVYLPYEG